MPNAKLLAAILTVTSTLVSPIASADAPATAPTTTGATTVASTTPTATAATTTTADTISLEGYLAPRDAFKAKVTLKAFTGALKTTQVVPHGSVVKSGDALIGFDPTEIEEAILLAASEAEVGKANLAKAEADVTLGDRADAASAEQKNDALADAQAQLDWWKKQDGPFFIKGIEMGVKNARDAVDDQNDELDQLRKMYQSESLTNATADIVVKRAVRQLETTKEMAAIQAGNAEKQKATEYGNQQQAVERGLVAAKQALDEFQVQAAQSRTQRGAALLGARISLRAAQRKLSELEQDKSAMAIVAPADGIAFFGSFENGQWQNASPDAIELAQRIDPARTLLTLVQPGRVRVVGKASEAEIFKLKVGAEVGVTIVAAGDLSLTGTIATLAALPAADGTFEVGIDLKADAPPRCLPGMKAKIEVTK